MDLLLLSVISPLVAGFFSTLVSRFIRRAVEPTNAEVNRAAELAREAWPKVSMVASKEEPAPDQLLDPNLVLALDPEATPTQAGDQEALKILSAYATDLRAEAARIAKRVSAEHPSPFHVQTAADHIGILRQSASILADIGLAVGSLLIGGVAAFGINLATGAHAASGSLAWAISLGSAGLVVFSLSAGTKWAKR